MNQANIVDALIKDIKERLTLDGKNRVFNEGKELRSEFMNEEAEPEAFTREFLLDKIFSALELEKLSEKKIVDSRGLRSVDYRIKSKRGMFLVEAKPLNADLEKGKDSGVKQIKGLFKLAEVQKNYDFGVATNGLRWVFIDKNEEIVRNLGLEEDFEQIKEFLVGKEKVVSPKREEEISKKFYDWYNALLHGGRYKDLENKTKTISEADCVVSNVVEVKKLDEREQIAQVVINRLIFIRFLQSKGIIKEDILYYLSKIEEDLLTLKLKQLFFSVLNKPKDTRVDIDELFKNIPYLNGNLFDYAEAEIKNPGYKIKAEILKKVIVFLDSFNFVHKEQFGKASSIDPEILGYIFERAMTATDRKGTGAYYTPKQITKYISENTIYPYIIEKTNEFLKTIKGYKETELIKDIEKLFILPATTLEEIWRKIIQEIRVLDNACGSGAFLLAVANILFDLNRRIDDKLELGNSDTALKKWILMHNLYGVDINPNGIEIAKLRLWLWLVDSYDPEHIEPLPNIDYNFRVGNSLIGYVDIGEFKEAKVTLEDYSWNEEKTSLDHLLRERNKLKWEYKRAEGEGATELKVKLDESYEKISNLLNVNLYREFREKKIKISREEFLRLNPFHWGFEFYEVFALDKPKEERGFDVVIGNPPYISSDTMSKLFTKGYLKMLKTNYDEVIKIGSKPDIFFYFVKQSLDAGKKGSYLGYIIPNRIISNDACLEIRKLLLKNKLRTLVSFSSGIEVFHGVNVHSSIIIASKVDEISSGYSYFSQYIGGAIQELTEYRGVFIPNKISLYFGVLFDKINQTQIEILKGIIKYEKMEDFAKIREGIRGKSISIEEFGNIKEKQEYLKEIRGYNIDKYCIHNFNGYYHLPLKERKKLNNKTRQFGIKTIFPELSDKIEAYLDKDSYMGYGGVYFISSSDIDKSFDLKVLTALLNSTFLTNIYKILYSSGSWNKSLKFRSSYLGKIPVILSQNQQPFITLCDYMLFLNETEEKRKNEKELIEFIDNQVIDSLVYELYFKEKFEEDGLKTNLFGLVEPYLEDIEGLESGEEKLRVVKEVVDGIENNRAIKEQIEQIKGHAWVKEIES